MVRVAFSSILCLLGVSGDDEASLLQANAGKKRIQAHHSTTSHWVEDFAKSPKDVIARVSDMQPTEQQNLLELFASADASTLAKELEPHKEKLALILRGSPLHTLAKGPTSTMVSALQQRSGVLEEVILSKKDQIRKKNDGQNSSSFPAEFEAKKQMYSLTGGRCRNGREFEDIDFDTACNELCAMGGEDCTVGVVEAGGLDANSTEPDVCKRAHVDANDFATGEGLNEADTCYELCELDPVCYGSEFEEGVCKRFYYNMKTYKRKTLLGCAKKCNKIDECVAFEWDNGECELHDNSTDADLSVAEEIGDEHACYMKVDAEADSEEEP